MEVIEGNIGGSIEVTIRRGIRRKQVLDDPNEKRRYLKLKEGILFCYRWKTRFGRGCEHVVSRPVQAPDGH